MRTRVAGGLIGVVFGVILCWSGMANPEVIRQALLFDDFYLYGMFATAVATAAIGLRLTGTRPVRDRPQRRHVTGALIFGTGWGVSNVCPGPIAAQLGLGVPWALFTLAGALLGVWLYLRRVGVETEPACEPATPPRAALATPVPDRGTPSAA
jgi:hypothetical protein